MEGHQSYLLMVTSLTGTGVHMQHICAHLLIVGSHTVFQVDRMGWEGPEGESHAGQAGDACGWG
jgi:hypothetical protein